MARFVSEVRFHRGSTQKARLVADLIRGKTVDEALNLLNFSQKRASDNMSKALNAAIADAELADADVTELFVVESRVDEGPHIKRFRPKDRGRAHPIIKQTSHITVGVQERA
ncbi:MAG: 50S ribosomal protein L22 [Phycisphaera sp.]|nr:MAG: 50S ribosomal protein L22 [Phycisphaera sp.]